ncbi:MAG: PEGA domain-containing protein [Alistipes sp.]|nr:PEGA domain-containing protein [Alistipes sp.]
MKRPFSVLMMVLVALVIGAQGFVFAQTQQHSIIIDAESLAPVQTDIMSGVAIDKIPLDSSRRPCARIKMRVNYMSREEIDKLSVRTIGGNVVVMRQTVASEGNGLIIELTAKQPTRFYLHHDKYGDSNEVSLNLEGDKEYRLEARLDISYIFVTSNVADADVYIDGEYKGRTDSDFALMVKDIQPGKHRLKIQHGTEDAERDINITSDNLTFRLEISTKSARPQIVEFNVTPQYAKIYIDNTPYSANNDGVVTIALNKGSYNYRVSADMYYDEIGSLTVVDSTVSRNIALKPAYGWVEIESNAVLNGAKIYIDDSYIGKAPLKSNKLASGEHRIEVIQEMYLPYKRTVLIKDNETLLFNPSLNANFATVTLNVDNEAKIYVNNEYKGFSTWTGNLAVGQYTFEARKDNHYPTTITQNISVNPAKQTYTLNTPRPIVGELNITSTPPNAEVYIDGKLIGTTQLKHNVIIGNHEIVVKAKGYRSNKQSVTIAEGETINVTFTLEEGSDIPNNVIEYVSKISSANYLSGAGIKSHTWDSKTGKGKIVFESDVTTIGERAFWADNIKSITIPGSVTTIRDCAFYGCNYLTRVYCTAITPPTGGSNMFDFNASNRKIYVPMESVKAYKSAAGWREYASDIVGYNFNK